MTKQTTIVVTGALRVTVPYKFVADHILIFVLYFFKEIKVWYFMWIICLSDNWHEILSLIFYEKLLKKKITIMLSAAVIIGALSVKMSILIELDDFLFFKKIVLDILCELLPIWTTYMLWQTLFSWTNKKNKQMLTSAHVLSGILRFNTQLIIDFLFSSPITACWVKNSADDILKYFFFLIFPGQQDLTLHANCLLRRHFE